MLGKSLVGAVISPLDGRSSNGRSTKMMKRDHNYGLLWMFNVLSYMTQIFVIIIYLSSLLLFSVYWKSHMSWSYETEVTSISKSFRKNMLVGIQRCRHKIYNQRYQGDGLKE